MRTLRAHLLWTSQSCGMIWIWSSSIALGPVAVIMTIPNKGHACVRQTSRRIRLDLHARIEVNAYHYLRS